MSSLFPLQKKSFRKNKILRDSSTKIISSSTAAFASYLERHNTDWTQRWQVWCCHGGIPGCGLGQIVTPALRNWVDSFLPWQEFAHSLCRLGRSFLPSPDWLPLILQNENSVCPIAGKEEAPLSILEFWQQMPEIFRGKLCFRQEDLLPLFCALADPPRYGTIPGRYPEQIQVFEKLLQGCNPEAPLHLLDLGCGVGLGSFELLQTALQQGFRTATLTGLTAQPLESWMATQKRLPHDPAREQLFRSRFAGLKADFRVGLVQKFQLPGRFDFIFCNGLAGGRYLQQDKDISGFLAACQQHLLSGGGRLLLSNHFHEGHRRGVERLLELADQNGWICTGNWQNLALQK